MRHFEKVSIEEFSKYFDPALYNDYKLPERKTKYSAGYDFSAILDITLKSGEKKMIPTGIKAVFENDETLLLVVRSSLGVKYDLRMCNQVGVIESDYYNNIDNEGHMFICLKNEGTEDFTIKKGTSIVQGIFTKFLTCGDEPENIRKGGFGSTEKEGELK